MTQRPGLSHACTARLLARAASAMIADRRTGKAIGILQSIENRHRARR
jgi:hypothetical protein